MTQDPNMKAGNPYLGMAVNFITNPWVMAGLGGAAGYYFFGRKNGKTIEGKRPYVAAGVGVAAGLAAGKLIQHYRMKAAGALPAQQQVPQMMTPEQQAQAQAQSGMADYYNMENVEGGDVDAAFGQPPMGQPGAYGEQGVPLQAEMEEPMGLGSLDGTSLGGSEGLGSFARETGFDAYEDGVDEAIDEVRRRGAN